MHQLLRVFGIGLLAIALAAIAFVAPARAYNPVDLEYLLREGSCIRCDLAKANLQNANLAGINLYGAYLWQANLRGANLADANLSGAYLQEANMQGAELKGTNLAGANLWEANMQNARWCHTIVPNGYTANQDC